MNPTERDIKENWNRISTFQKLSEKFIEDHKNYINWSFISSFQELSEKFIKRNKNYVDWDNISLCQVLSEKFIWDNINLLEPDYIAESQILSKEFLSKRGNIFNWNILSEYQPFISNFKRTKLHSIQVMKEIYWEKNMKRIIHGLLDIFIIQITTIKEVELI